MSATIARSRSHCKAKYVVKLSNHLTDVHQLDYGLQRKWLQKAKLQPKVRVVIYQTNTSQRSETSPSKPQEGNDAIVYQLTIPRKGKTSVEILRKGSRKARKRIKQGNRTT